ncbi:MAG: hypothetical protein M1326_02425 [Cyanobacteria bacterium]|nr:hypothetical protein [Cyanobacteriota bacterium]
MKNMKKFLIISIIFFVIGVVGLIADCLIFNEFYQRIGYGTSRGYIFEPEDMMNMMRGNWFKEPDLKSYTFDEVKKASEKYLSDSGLKDIKIKEIMEFSNNFYIETVEESTGIGAIELLLDKGDGSIFPEFGPNMMWNLKYGMHGRLNLDKSKLNMKIGEEEAINIANNYLTRISHVECVTLMSRVKK